MRTQGTFRDVYEAAKEYMNDKTHLPHDPVVRRVGDVWMLESGLNDEPDASLEVSLDAFQSWFYESFEDDNFDPENCIDEFVQQHSDSDEDY